MELSSRFRHHIKRSLLSSSGDKRGALSDPSLLKSTEYDFHAETKGGYEAASNISRIIGPSADAFGYFLMQSNRSRSKPRSRTKEPDSVLLQQEGVFRTNCLDCLDRTNLVQGILSRMAIESFLEQSHQSFGPDLWVRHSTLWADNGDVGNQPPSCSPNPRLTPGVEGAFQNICWYGSFEVELYADRKNESFRGFRGRPEECSEDLHQQLFRQRQAEYNRCLTGVIPFLPSTGTSLMSLFREFLTSPLNRDDWLVKSLFICMTL